MARVQLNSLPAGTVLIAGTFAPAAGAIAHVYTHGTVTHVTVFSAETGATTLTQPLTADSNGQLPGWVAAGQTLDISATYLGGAATAGMAEALDGSQIIGPAVTKTGNYTLAATDRVVLGDATSAGFTLTLPDATAFTGAYWLKAINTNSNLVTVATTSAQTIDGASTITLGPPVSSAPYVSVTLVSDTANWRTI